MRGASIVRLVVAVALSIGVLYLTIWPHELGHSLIAHLHGCKPTWYETDMSWFLWSSWGGDIDYPCLAEHGGSALFWTDVAGVIVNLMLIAAAALVGRWWRHDETPGSLRGWIVVATGWWALANYAEAFSYLLLNTAWLSSDMKTVVEASGTSQWLWFGLGVAGGVAVAWWLTPVVRRVARVLGAPRAWVVAQIFYVLVVSGFMGAARWTLT